MKCLLWADAHSDHAHYKSGALSQCLCSMTNLMSLHALLAALIPLHDWSPICLSLSSGSSPPESKDCISYLTPHHPAPAHSLTGAHSGVNAELLSQGAQRASRPFLKQETWQKSLENGTREQRCLSSWTCNFDRPEGEQEASATVPPFL